MGKTITSFAQLRDECEKKMFRAMSNAESKTYLDLNNNMTDAYSASPGKYYERTGQLRNSTRTTNVQGSGSHLHSEIYLDPMYEYDTGTYTAAKVMSEAEVGGSGILLNSGFWEKTEEDARKNIADAFGAEFGK